ncbi:tyrosine-type recombinase/integrase [Thermodesulfobacteriota bacterium]
MAVLAECPICHRKVTIKKVECPCGANMAKLKRQKKKVKYHINFLIPDGKDESGKKKFTQRREYIGYSIDEAKDADGKRKVQKREKRIFDMLPDTEITLEELSEWYLSLKGLKSYRRKEGIFKNINAELGNRIVSEIKPIDLQNYQDSREEQGAAPRTIDYELSVTRTMIYTAFENDKVSGRTLKAFKSKTVENRLKKGSNARKRVVTIDEYISLLKVAADHLKPIIAMAYNTGMRKGEIRQLRWKYIDWEKGFIRLPAEITKERKEKAIPMNHHVASILKALRPLRAVGKGYQDFVFTYNGAPITHKDSLQKSLKTACKDAEITYGQKVENGLIFRDIRRTVKTNMLAAEVQKEYRDTILGHSLEGMDVHYIKPSEDDLKTAMEKYTTWLDTQISEREEGRNLVNSWSILA